ncbi:MAG: transglycosylase domain-containing protein [Tychonema bourrellyi B0820]|uniref:Penicillin-binding protein n=1 Tax=Tychonema bourrellyi FEM_GT703 TaxID=2040638 RepID=A0A2G4EUQ7_9CYAN|nr:transglycosylase domain-containing protein [Tychonema bourrellyi]MDQ2099340.1 transglycosylase domain-containing protein [Tychonema bourrellyi B0820]PHX53282.1 penicillin-binding protein [Tychonema bourrellyi FEM_GT703]
MTPPQPPHKPQTVLGAITQAVQTIAKVNFNQLVLKPNAKVPELWVQDAGAAKAEVYPLLGDRYLLGRSSKSSDIVIRNPVVSHLHLSLSRDTRLGTPFVIKDENSTNGIYRGKKRIESMSLRHGDVFTLGPPELADAVRIQYIDPPPLYSKVLRYGFYGISGATALIGMLIGIESTKFQVRPLPRSVNGPVIVYARDGQTPLRPPQNNAHLELKTLPDFSPYLAKAIIASEDSRYNWHLGVDPLGVLRALLTNFRGGGIREGGSTLTQQLARSLFRDYVGTQDSAGRKFREAIVALKLESYYSKDELLLTYLNRVFLGIDLYGFEDAARFYFGKSAKDLTLSESATLAGILPAPNSFNPIQNYQLAVQYRDRVIERMRVMGTISQEEADRARRSRIEINPKAREFLQSTIAPYFYSYVFDELEFLLGEQLAREGNFIVETGLNPSLQKLAESSLRNAVENSGARAGFSQGAVVTLNTKNGEVLALVGGVNYRQSQFNRATQALRQPGSTFKIFSYTAALEQGIPASKSYSCEPLSWGGQSYSGCERTSGSADMYRGLAQSENAIALRVAQDVGLENVVRMAKRFGITSPLRSAPGLVLGESEVNVLQLTGAFGVLANRGLGNRPHVIKRIIDSSDCQDIKNFKTCRVVYDYQKDGVANQQLVSEVAADTMTDMLQGVVRGGTGSSAALGLGEAGKTGTTNDNKDLWFVGYIPSEQLVTGVWLGNDDNSPTQGGSRDAAQLWGDYMRQVAR